MCVFNKRKKNFMSVDGVNNSSNAGLYAASGMVLGAGAGAATGYLTKPFLKNGAPTDSFIKAMCKNMLADYSEAEKNHYIEFKNKINEAKSVEELKNVMIADALPPELSGALDAKIKQSLLSRNTYCNLEQLGLKMDEDYLKKLSSAETYEDLRNILRDDLDKSFSGKSLEDIKTSFKSKGMEFARNSGKKVFEQYWDSSKKAFVNCEDGVGKAVKKAAQSIQGKYALMYGAIGAAVLGVAGYLFGGSKEIPEASQKVDMQV